MKTSAPARTRARDIEQALAGLQIDDLCVEVLDDRVYLKGVATCYDRKRQAGKLAAARAVDAYIENEIRVAAAGDCGDVDVMLEVSDSIAERAGRHVLERLTIEATRGSLVISGVVRDIQQRHAVEQAAWEVSRGMRVESRISTEAAAVSDEDVGEALNQYVERAMNLRPGAIVVRYASGIASLFGDVSSVVQSEAIEDLVRWHDQVTDVMNGLRVAGPSAALRGAHPAL